MNKTKCAGGVMLLVLAAALTACGGGAGSDNASAGSTTGGTTSGSTSGTSSGTPSTQVVATAGTLQTSAAAATYASGSQQSGFFNELTTLRQAAGAGVVNQSTLLDAAAQAHATYLTANLATVGVTHNEVSTEPDYYEATPSSRIAKAGFNAGFTTEVIGGTGASDFASDCVFGLMDTVYHSAALLSQETVVGIGIGSDVSGTPMCVADMADASSDQYGQVPASGAMVAYPYAGQTNVLETFYVADESPRPSSTLFPNQTAGTPVVVSLRNADYVNFQAAGTLQVSIQSFSLKDSSGNLIPAAVLASASMQQTSAGPVLNADANLAQGFVVLVPLAPLTKGVTYTATFSATLQTGGATLTKSWSFTTNS